MPTLSEERIKAAFERLLAMLAIDKTERIRNLRDLQKEIGDVNDLEREKSAIQAEREVYTLLLPSVDVLLPHDATAIKS